jgi:hypothetical protein
MSPRCWRFLRLVHEDELRCRLDGVASEIGEAELQVSGTLAYRIGNGAGCLAGLGALVIVGYFRPPFQEIFAPNTRSSL